MNKFPEMNDPNRKHSISLLALFDSLWRNRELVLQLTKREVIGRYKGSFLGMLWSFLHPIFMLAIYTFVFSVVFKARWGTADGSKTEFALILFCGLLVFNVFSETINKAPTLILSNANYVKKIIFPLEILPGVALCSSLFHALVGFSVWLIFYGIIFGCPPASALFLPVVLLPLVLLTLGLAWILASLGVFLRDVSQVVGVATTALMFMSPIFFPLASIPAEYRDLMKLNPLTPIVEQVRDVLYWGHIPDLSLLAIYVVTTGAFSWLGFAWFQKTRKGFADVL